MTHICPNRIYIPADKEVTRPAEVAALAPMFEKSATKLKLKQKLLKCKSTIQIVTLNVRSLNRKGQQPEMTASAIDHNKNIISIQEHWYIHIKYYDTSNGWTFVSASARENTVNAAIGFVGMLIGPRALKLLNSTEKIQTMVMTATFNGNPCATFISYQCWWRNEPHHLR